MKRCPRCSSEISKFDKLCPRCGLPVAQMEEFSQKFGTVAGERNDLENQESKVLSKRDLKRQKKEEKKAKKKAEKEERKRIEKNNDTEFFKFATNSGVEDDEDTILDTDTYSERKKKLKRKANKPVFDIDENGEFDINTDDVELIGKETGKIIDETYEQSYSVKKSRGDYIPPKIKWWEIYKIADRHFARRKIKKEVSKASKIKPKFVKKSKLLLLAIFLGFTGAHNFYAKNKSKGWWSIITLFVSMGVVILAEYSAFFSSIQISIGGCAGFVNVFIWISDIINIISNQFRYKIQKDQFISLMNVETRAKLGEKYIDMDLYRKPWYVRFGVWCKKLKKNFAEWKRDRRQRNIDKEKAKLAELEAQESENLKKTENSSNPVKEENETELNSKEILSEKTLNEISSFGEDDSANLENENEEKSQESEEKPEEKKRKVGNLYKNKYNAFNNKKSNKKKKK